MHKNLLRRPIQCALAFVCLCTMTNGAPAGWFTRGCAARDLQILMLIEDREDVGAVSAEALNEAMLAMLQARIVCHDGRVADALTLYDRIATSITPDTILYMRRR
jgi:hypothetical protein